MAHASVPRGTRDTAECDLASARQFEQTAGAGLHGGRAMLKRFANYGYHAGTQWRVAFREIHQSLHGEGPIEAAGSAKPLEHEFDSDYLIAAGERQTADDYGEIPLNAHIFCAEGFYEERFAVRVEEIAVGLCDLLESAGGTLGSYFVLEAESLEQREARLFPAVSEGPGDKLIECWNR